MIHKGVFMEQAIVAIVGMGVVGSTAAHTLMLSTQGINIMLVDINESKCKGEKQDLDDALSTSGSSTVFAGTLKDAGQADIIVITAGVPQKPGQTRLELLETNKTIMSSIVEKMQPIKSSSIIIVVANPVDILTLQVQKIAGLPQHQIFGSGTLLDTIRLKEILSATLEINADSINIDVLGEHGDTQFAVWSTATVNGMPLETLKKLTQIERDEIEQAARNKAYEIIACKGSTSFGIAACIETYCHAILYNKKSIIPVSCYQALNEVCLSVPAVIGKKGVEQIMPLLLNQDEQEKMNKCIETLKKYSAL